MNFGAGDVVYAGGGNDVIDPIDQAVAFTAHICGGSGDDSIRGGRGTDHVNGGHGADTMDGGYGGFDTLLGAAGNDRIQDFDDIDYEDESDPGTDTLRGGAGDDELITGVGTDKVYGDGGSDTFTDYTRAKSYLYGGGGNDRFDATQNYAGTIPFAPDFVSGQAGFDVAVVNRNDVVTASTERRIVR